MVGISIHAVIRQSLFSPFFQVTREHVVGVRASLIEFSFEGGGVGEAKGVELPIKVIIILMNCLNFAVYFVLEIVEALVQGVN